MGNASIIPSSALWLALVACYDAPPDVQLHVTRPSSLWNVKNGVCHEGTAGPIDCTCDNYLWNNADKATLTRRQAIYVNDASEVVYVLVESSAGGGPTRWCHRVVLGAETVVRDVELGGDVWSCGSASMCEDSIDCTTIVDSCPVLK